MKTGAIVRFIERFLKRWEEGPEPPERLHEVVEHFGKRHPRATRGDWARFAAEHARQAYREGFRRGYEHVERDPDGWKPEVPPELIADLLDPTWRDRAIVVGGDAVEVPEAITESEATLFDLNTHLKELVDETERNPKPPFL